MKKIKLFLFLNIITGALFAQETFTLGVKGGANFSKISFDIDNYSSEMILKSHIGAFMRIGWERLYFQPEIYFTGKGGQLNPDFSSVRTSFNYKAFDMPLLIGFHIFKGENAGLHILAGPVYSGITKNSVRGEDFFDNEFYRSHYFGYQYGLGIDLLFLTLDARMENGFCEVYNKPGTSGTNQTFMLSLGIKIL